MRGRLSLQRLWFPRAAKRDGALVPLGTFFHHQTESQTGTASTADVESCSINSVCPRSTPTRSPK